ncbi:MAG: hypothetical protein LBU91_01815 [Bacteroidales bacterium]|jgi:hypothetical protein|nr:hypothetical protein [Bacteroidales bacterium]
MQSYEKNPTFQTTKTYNWSMYLTALSHVGFWVAIGLTTWFHYLRTTFGESAMVFFNLVNAPNLWSAETWLSANWFQNVLTILTVNGQCSLTFVSMVFSSAPMIYTYLIFIVCRYGFKQTFSGVFLLLLLLGVNYSFFGAVNSTYDMLCTLYFGLALIVFICTKYIVKTHALFELGFFGLLAIYTQLLHGSIPTVIADSANSVHAFSRLNYLLSMAINNYVIIGCMVVFLCLVWLVKKDYRALGVFGGLAVVLFLITFRCANILFTFDFEQIYLPLAALVLMAMNGYVWEPAPLNKWRLGIIGILLCLSIGGQLRMLPTFEKRFADVQRLQEAAFAFPSEKIALAEHFQATYKYMDARFLPFETAVISGLYNLPPKSIWLYPTDSAAPTEDKLTSLVSSHTDYFPFSETQYTVLNEPIIPRKLIFDTVFAPDTAAVTTVENRYALGFGFGRLEQGDSIHVEAWRKGSDYGHLVLSDGHNPNIFWMCEQTTGKPNSFGWQKLSYTFVVNQSKEPLKTYVCNLGEEGRETIFFGHLWVRIWRE